MTHTLSDPLIGATVSHYEILAKLGGGGMGVVYAARDTRLGRRVALKFLPPQWSHDETAKQRFIREAQAASATDHRNICTIHDVDTAPDGRLFIVMAHYDGPTLKEKLEEGPLPVEEAVEIAAQVAEGLARAHTQGVVHRDVKPGNLILTEDGVRILDFGLARFVGSLHLTLDGSTLGTVAYMSPEQSRGEDADARSDVWSVGVVFYEMLTGELPFKGAYAEAISHAIRNDPVPPLQQPGLDRVPTVERIVRRALEKDPAQRYQSARELARDLRLIQGRTLPIDLKTGVVDAPVLGEKRRRGGWLRSATSRVAAASIAALVGVAAWLMVPVDRVRVVVAPVVNQTGYTELDPYRLGLTQELIAQISDSVAIRVLPFERLLPIVRRFRRPGDDLSSRAALQAIATHSGARLILVPTLLYDEGAWRARVEVRDSDSATNAARFETESVASLRIKETAHALMISLGGGVDRHFLSTMPLRARLLASVRGLLGGTAPRLPVSATLDAAQAFADALDAYGALEYGSAAQALEAATRQDSRNPMFWAWRSHVALLLRQDDQAREAAAQALQQIAAAGTPGARAFIRAASAEARRDFPTAATEYLAWIAADTGEPEPLMALGGFQDRRAMNAEAVAAYRRALELGVHLPRARLELCRLYNRLTEWESAKQEARLAREQYAELGDSVGEAHVLLCMADTLRVGSPADREEARQLAERAASLFSESQSTYNTPRAHYYLAMISGMQGRSTEALAFGEQALSSAQAGGNFALQPRILNNLGVTSEAAGKWREAREYYRQSYRLSETFGDERDAAGVRVNAGALAIEYGGDLLQGLREVQGALSTAQKLGDRDLETFCLQLLGAYNRYTGNHVEAERVLRRALAIARERGLKEDAVSVMIDIARSRMEVGDHAGAQELLQQAIGDGSTPRSGEARARLSVALAHMGDAAGAAAALQQAASLENEDLSSRRLLNEAAGQVAYEAGHFTEARRRFSDAAALDVPEAPDGAALEARIRLGLLDVLEQRFETARKRLEQAIGQAQEMGRYSLEIRGRIYLARAQLASGDGTQALAVLQDVSPGVNRSIGPELQAQLHYWRAQALAMTGDSRAAQTESAAAQALLMELSASVREELRSQFARRPDIRALSIN